MKYAHSQKQEMYNNFNSSRMFNRFNFLNSHVVDYSFIRITLKIAVWIGIVLFSVFALIYLGFFIAVNFFNFNQKIIENTKFLQFLNVVDVFSWKIIWVLLIPGIFVAHIYFSIIILKFLHQFNDEELEQNKWLLIFLAIHLTFGFWLAFLITRLKNNETKSTIDSKKTISNIYSRFWIIKYSFVLIAMLIFLIKEFSTGNIGSWTTQNYVLCPLILVIAISLLTVGVVLHVLFKDETINEQIHNHTAKGRAANFFAWFALTFVLAKLGYTIFQSCLKILGLFTGGGNSNNNYGGGFFAFFYRLAMLGLTIFYIKILVDTWKGIFLSYKEKNKNTVYLRTIPHPKQMKQFEEQRRNSFAS